MAKPEMKTTATSASVTNFIAAVPDSRRRAEAEGLDSYCVTKAVHIA